MRDLAKRKMAQAGGPALISADSYYASGSLVASLAREFRHSPLCFVVCFCSNDNNSPIAQMRPVAQIAPSLHAQLFYSRLARHDHSPRTAQSAIAANPALLS